MPDKKIYTREEFENLRQESSKAKSTDKKLRQGVQEVLVMADHYRWVHQTN